MNLTTEFSLSHEGSPSWVAVEGVSLSKYAESLLRNAYSGSHDAVRCESIPSAWLLRPAIEVHGLDRLALIAEAVVSCLEERAYGSYFEAPETYDGFSNQLSLDFSGVSSSLQQSLGPGEVASIEPTKPVRIASTFIPSKNLAIYIEKGAASREDANDLPRAKPEYDKASRYLAKTLKRVLGSFAYRTQSRHEETFLLLVDNNFDVAFQRALIERLPLIPSDISYFLRDLGSEIKAFLAAGGSLGAAWGRLKLESDRICIKVASANESASEWELAERIK